MSFFEPGTLVHYDNGVRYDGRTDGWAQCSLDKEGKWVIHFFDRNIVDCNNGDHGLVLGFILNPQREAFGTRYAVLINGLIAAIPVEYVKEYSNDEYQV